MENKFFEELSRRLREGGIESSNVEDKRLEVFLHGRPVLFVSPGHDAFLLPAGSQNQKASELYHRVAGMADEVYEYVEAVQNAPLLRASSLKDEFHLLADFGGAVLAGIELPKEWGYQFNTWIWNYDRTALLYPVFYSARRLYDLKPPMEVEDLAHRNLVSDMDFLNIIYATLIARHGKAVMDAGKEAQNGLCNPSGAEQRPAPGIWADYDSIPHSQGGIRPHDRTAGAIGNRRHAPSGLPSG